ncbi:MAG TPA: hypothetical protein VIK62_08785 [Verrucomicrobiae bacterium]
MMPTKKQSFSYLGIFLVLLVGLVARLLAAARGHNADMDAYFIVAKIMAGGGNVYAETTRYNYGPIWFLILHGLDLIARHHEVVLRWLIALFLSLADVGIFALLYRQAGRLPAVLFFLNPISIIVTGYHSQFDNLALGIGLVGALLVEDEPERPLSRRGLSGLLLLGLSLTVKHDLFLFPLWLAVKRQSWREKFIILFVPTAVFLTSFLPWWAGSHGGIVQNVFQYRSNYASCFYTLMLPEVAQAVFSSQTWWLLLLMMFAFICRPKNNFCSFLIYTGVLVATSPATTNQYLAIPVALVSVYYRNPFFIGYTLLGACHLCEDGNGLHLWSGLLSAYDSLAIYSLCLGLIWQLWPQVFVWPVEKIRQEIRFQFCGKK